MQSVPDSPERERLLWLQVIRQAQFDAEGRREVEPTLVRRAQRWLTKMTYSFLTVCSLAGMPETQAYYLQEQERRRWLTLQKTKTPKKAIADLTKLENFFASKG